MRKYKIKYWHCGNICVKTVEAETQYDALLKFYMATEFTDIISVEDVTDNVV